MRSKLVVASREALAVVRQAALLRHDVSAPVLPRELRPGADVVVCLHGLFATAGVVRPLRLRLETAGVATATMTFAPGPGLDPLADRLGAVLAELGDVRLHLVGHSLGGLVARRYATRAIDERVVQTISLGSPFAGLRLAALGAPRAALERLGIERPGASRLGLGLARDLDEQSSILREIRLAVSSVPHLSIVAADDQFVASPLAHALPGGHVELVSACGHNAMLFDERVSAVVERQVLARVGGVVRDHGRVSQI